MRLKTADMDYRQLSGDHGLRIEVPTRCGFAQTASNRDRSRYGLVVEV